MTDFSNDVGGPARLSPTESMTGSLGTMELAEPVGGGEFRQPEREFTVKARSQRQIVVRRFFHHKLAIACLIVLILVFLFAFVGPYVWRCGLLRTHRSAVQAALVGPSDGHRHARLRHGGARSCGAPRSRS